MERDFVGKKEFPIKCEIGRGLEGAIVNNTQIGYVNGKEGRLCYRGISIEDLAKYSLFEETAYLLLFGKLPKRDELNGFQEKLKVSRSIPQGIVEMIKILPKDTHSMNLLMSAVAALAGYDKESQKVTLESEKEVAIRIISKIATVTAAISRIKKGKEVIEPREDLSHAENLVYMITGEVDESRPSLRGVDEEISKAIDMALILHADHGMSGSTFTCMVIHASLSDFYATIAGGIGSLKGPLHGGANERVIKMLQEIGTPSNVEEWYGRERKLHHKIPGFGHRIYHAHDPRARIFKEYCHRVATTEEIKNLLAIAERLEEVEIRELGEKKGIFPNVDFYSGIVYKALGLETSLFTPLFAVSRVAGWTARVLEYMPENRIFRPRAEYYGPLKQEYIPMEKR
ncbi:citrate synthase/methylcitrate synthase [bacterium]|nr:citrate synthase/methylcitrate synthase [bacterium]